MEENGRKVLNFSCEVSYETKRKFIPRKRNGEWVDVGWNKISFYGKLIFIKS